jgi:hypothetical protein
MDPTTTASPVPIPVKPKRNICCAMGKFCINSRLPIYEWMKQQQQSQGGASSSATVLSERPPSPLRGKMIPTASALIHYPKCFLSCGHFCCNWVPNVAIEVGAVQPGQTCATMHPFRCNQKGGFRYDEMIVAAQYHGMLRASRPGSVRRNKGDVMESSVSYVWV